MNAAPATGSGGGRETWYRTDGLPPTTPDTTAMPIIRFLAELRAGMAWVHDAACAGAPDSRLWFPERGASTREAKAICAGCPVQPDCLEYGLNEKHGIWGGRSERERRAIRRQRNKAARMEREAS